MREIWDILINSIYKIFNSFKQMPVETIFIYGRIGLLIIWILGSVIILIAWYSILYMPKYLLYKEKCQLYLEKNPEKVTLLFLIIYSVLILVCITVCIILKYLNL